VLTLKEFDESLTLDHKQQWSDISQHVSRNIMPAIDRTLKEKNFVYTKSELKYVL
ncbi:12204_t:CDS:1, partial [Funneliformis caledonium]